MKDLDEETLDPGQGVRKALGALRRRKWPMLLTSLAVVTAVASTVAFLPDVYRSTATVIIERQQIPDELVRSTVTSALEIRLSTISQQILSDTRLEKLIRELGLYEKLRETEPSQNVLDLMRRNIRIDLQGGGQDRRREGATVAFTVSYAAADPETAARVANTLTSYFVEENLKERERVATGTADFLRTQLQDAREKLDVLEAQVSQFKMAHIGSLPEQLSANLATLEQLSGQLRVNSDRQTQTSERLAALEAQLAELAGATGEPRTPDERLAMLQRTLRQLRTRYSEKHPDVVRVRTEIAALEQLIREAPEVGGSLVEPLSPQAAQLQRQLNDLQAEARMLVAEADNLREAIARYQRRVEMTPESEQQFASVSREYETTKALYRSLMEREREAELAESMEQRQKGEQFRVLDPARPSPEPTAPKRGRLLALGLVLALGFALAVGASLEILDPSLHIADDLKSVTSIPVIATIPRIATPAELRTRRRRLRWGALFSAAGLLLIAGASFLLTREHGPLTVLLMN